MTRTPTRRPKTDEGVIVFEEILLRNVLLRYREAGDETPLTIFVERFDLETDAAGMVELEISGHLNEIPVEASGQIGTVDNLLDMTEVKYRPGGHVGEIEFTSEGTIAELATFDGPDLQFEVHGPDLAYLMVMLGLPAPLPGPFRIAGRTEPAAGAVNVDLDVELRDLHAEVDGTVASLLDVSRLDLVVKSSGPDLAAIGVLAGVEGLPKGPFEISGRLLHDEERTEFQKVSVQIGDNHAALDGVLGRLPRLIDSDFRFTTEGPDLSAFSTLTGMLRLPPAPFRIAGRLVRRADGIDIEELDARIGTATLNLAGKVGDWPKFSGTSLDLAWAAKPRRGVGLSASVLTNSYIKLGGTLSKPALTIRPLQTVTATTAAVATGGLSILAKGFWDRFTSGKRSCRKAKKRAGVE